MYNVSQAYLTALSKPAKVRRLTGTVGTVPFTAGNVIRDSMRLVNQCSEGNEVLIGTVYMGMLEMTFTDMDTLTNTWLSKDITMSEGLLIGEDTWEDVPLGIYQIVQANHMQDGVHVVAYDRMDWLDRSRWTDTELWSGTPWDALTEISSRSGVQLAQMQNQIQALPNGSVGFALYAENDISTCRDMLHWLCQAMGCFATINRQGKLELRKYKSTSSVDATIGANRRWAGGSISDFTTSYAAMSYDNLIKQETVVYGEQSPAVNHLTYDLGANPLIQYFDVDTPYEAIFGALGSINYTPFQVDMAASPAFDLGDIVQFTDVKEGWSPIGCVMSYDYEFHGRYTIEGYGSNPALAGVQSAVDKEFAALAAHTNANEIQYYTFTNGDTYNVSTTDVKIIDIKFGSIKDALVVFQAEVKCLVTPNTTGQDTGLTIKYIYDDQEIEYHPQETYEEGYHLLHLLYYYKTNGGDLSRLKVYLKCTGGTVQILQGDIQACVWGQGLVATNKWDGWIEPVDNIVEVDFSTTPGAIDAFEETLEVLIPQHVTIDLTDRMGEVVLSTVPADVIKINESIYINKKALSELTWQQVYELEGGWQELYDDYVW